MSATGWVEQVGQRRDALAAQRDLALEMFASGESIRAVARKIGVSPSTAWRWRHGPPGERRDRRPVTPVTNPTLKYRGETTLDALPFAHWLAWEVAARWGTLAAAARSLEMDPSRLARLMRPRPGARVSLDLVDRVVTAVGDPGVLDALYPFDESVPVPYEVA